MRAGSNIILLILKSRKATFNFKVVILLVLEDKHDILYKFYINKNKSNIVILI